MIIIGEKESQDVTTVTGPPPPPPADLLGVKEIESLRKTHFFSSLEERERETAAFTTVI